MLLQSGIEHILTAFHLLCHERRADIPHWLWLIAQNSLAWALVASVWHQSEEELILSIIRYVQKKGLKAKSHLLTWRSSVVNVICAVAAVSLFALQEIAGKHHMRFEFGTLTNLALVSTVDFNTAYLSRHLWLQHCGERRRMRQYR